MNGENLYPLGTALGSVAVPYPLYQRFRTLLDGIGLAGSEGFHFASNLVDVCHQHAETVVLRPATHPHDALCATWGLVGDITLDVLLARRPQRGEPRRQAPLRPMAFRITVAGRYAGVGTGTKCTKETIATSSWTGSCGVGYSVTAGICWRTPPNGLPRCRATRTAPNSWPASPGWGRPTAPRQSPPIGAPAVRLNLG